MRTQLKYVIIPTTAVTVSFIREGYHYNLKHNLFARKHPFSAPIQPLKTSQYSPPPHFVKMYDCQRRFLYLIIIIYLIIYISARVIYIGSHWGAGTCPDATMRARDARAAGRPAAAKARRAEGRGAVGGEYCKKQGGCVGFSDFMFTFARCRGGSGSCQRHLQERGGTDDGGQTTLQAAGTIHHGRRDYAPGHRDYAPWRQGLCTRSPGARTKDKRYIEYNKVCVY